MSDARARGIAAALFVAAVTLAALTHTADPASPTYGNLQPCATEDAPGPCRWDAEKNGNGTGRSFTVDRAGKVTYDTP